MRPTPHELPRQVGKFTIRSQLGAGAFGTVYLGHDPVLNRPVAVKVPHPARLQAPEAARRFLREARSAARLQHDHIVPVYEAGHDGTHHYLVSAYVAGHTLAHALQRGRPSFVWAARLLMQLAEALAYAHQQGVIHRDVKPLNVLLSEQGKAYLADFGLAFVPDASRALTREGAILGTPAYLAPELAAGKSGDPQPTADQYSLGVTFYEMLCGRLPFVSDRLDVILYHALHSAPPAPRTLRPDLPPELERICLKAMARQPQDRYPDCQALADDLRRWLEAASRTAGPARAAAPAPVAVPAAPVDGLAPTRSDAELHQRRLAVAPDSAESRLAAYRAALERGQWDAAFQELLQAVRLDARGFAPFPMGKYRPQRILSAGGGAVNFLCRDSDTHELVVVKALAVDALGREPGEVFQEAQALARLHHPGIVVLRTCGFADRSARARPYLVLEHFAEETLEEHVARNGPLAVAVWRAVAVQVAEALRAAHEQGVVHRDVRPANVLLRHDGGWQVKLLGFGLAPRGRGAGAAEYAAPEQLGQLAGVAVGPPADVYGFARTSCYALFGTTQPVLDHWERLPKELAKLLSQCLARTPDGRPSGFAAVLGPLRSAVPAPPPLLPVAAAVPPALPVAPAVNVVVNNTVNAGQPSALEVRKEEEEWRARQSHDRFLEETRAEQARRSPSEHLWKQLGCAAALLVVLGLAVGVALIFLKRLL